MDVVILKVVSGHLLGGSKHAIDAVSRGRAAQTLQLTAEGVKVLSKSESIISCR